MSLATTGAFSGLSTAYALNTAVPIDIDEAIYTLSIDDAPLILGINSDGYQVLPTGPTDQTEFEWLEEERLQPITEIKGSLAATATSISLKESSDVYRFTAGDLLKIEGSAEIMRVTAYGDNGVSGTGFSKTLTVVRGFGGTTAPTAAAKTGSRIVSLGVLLAEGSEPGDSRMSDRAKKSNYTQIFGPTKVQMSRTEQGRQKYGIANELTHQIMNRMKEDVQRREHTFLYGVKYQDANTKLRMTGGIDYWIPTSNTDTGAYHITVKRIEALMQKNYNKGGTPNILTANPASMSHLNDLDGNGRVRTEFADGRRGRQPVTVVWTEFGMVTLVRNRYCFPNNAFLWTREQATRRVFDPVRLERLAKTGDSDTMQMVCEEGMSFKGSEHASKFTGLTNVDKVTTGG